MDEDFGWKCEGDWAEYRDIELDVRDRNWKLHWDSDLFEGSKMGIGIRNQMVIDIGIVMGIWIEIGLSIENYNRAFILFAFVNPI